MCPSVRTHWSKGIDSKVRFAVIQSLYIMVLIVKKVDYTTLFLYL